MVSQTNEAALENHIENALAKDGYLIGTPAGFDREFTIKSKMFWELSMDILLSKTVKSLEALR